MDGKPLFGQPADARPFAQHYFSSTHEKWANPRLDTRPYPGREITQPRKARNQ
jgi:hypothetical protein